MKTSDNDNNINSINSFHDRCSKTNGPDPDYERERFINRNLPLVYAAAKRFRGRGADEEEICQSGIVGLIRAYDGYDEKRGVPFPSYAFKFIEGEMRNALRKSQCVHLSRGAREKMVQISEFIKQYESGGAELPKISIISDALGIEKTDICYLMSFSENGISLNAGTGEGEAVCESLKSRDDTEKSAVFNILKKQMIDMLPKAEASVILLRYENDMTQLETADRLKCSQAKVAKLEKSALMKIRAVFQYD